MIRCIPGIPVKKASPCSDPLQRPLSHIVGVTMISGDGQEIIGHRWGPNYKDYPEYSWIIEDWIEKNKGLLE